MTYYVSSGTLNLTKPKPKPKPTCNESLTALNFYRRRLSDVLRTVALSNGVRSRSVVMTTLPTCLYTHGSRVR